MLIPAPHVSGEREIDWENRLRGVPSFHYEPVFAQRVQRAIAEFSPACIALEIPSAALDELLWAVRQWPQPCASISTNTIFPFVPGDSIFEAARLAIRQGIPLKAVDIEVREPSPEGSEGDNPLDTVSLPDAQWAEHLGESWEAVLEATLPDPSLADLAREAYMARCLSDLLHEWNKVLWVGGAFHWSRILARLRAKNFQPPDVELAEYRGFRRAWLDASALFAVSGKFPRHVSSYADEPETYREGEMLQEAMTLSLGTKADASPVLIIGDSESQASDPVFELLQQESCTALDAARVMLYARNLAATAGLQSTPDVNELLTAAVAVIGPRYGGRLFQTLMQGETALPSTEEQAEESLPTLTYEKRHDQIGFWLGTLPVLVHPYWPVPGAGQSIWTLKPRVPKPPDYSSELGDVKRSWLSHPKDRVAYREFVHALFRIASQQGRSETHVVPFSCGIGEGIDVHATLRAADKDEIWVRELARSPLHITNAAIDWGNPTEFCPFLQGDPKEHYGWIDPSEFFSFGSCSREGPGHKILNSDPLVQLDRRRWTLLTLDRGTSSPRDNGSPETQKYPPSFYDEVIRSLIELPGQRWREDNVYEWLDTMFRFCSRKPFAYISQYTPSAKIYRVAARHRVTLVHIPLAKIPAGARARNEYFRFMTVPVPQWRKVMEHNHKNWF